MKHGFVRLVGVMLVSAVTSVAAFQVTAHLQRPIFPPAPRNAPTAVDRAKMKAETEAAFKKFAKGAPDFKVTRTRATVDERLTALETGVAGALYKLQFIQITDHVDPNFGHIYGWYVAGARTGLGTNYWMDKNRGEGAMASLGTDFDEIGLYVEMEGSQIRPPGSPPVYGIYVANLMQGGRPNYGLVASAAGSPTSIGAVISPSLLTDVGDGSARGMLILPSAPGMQLLNINEWYMGHSAADAKRIYP